MRRTISPTDSCLSAPTHVLCVDYSADVACVLRYLIDHEDDMQCVGCTQSCDHLIEDVSTLGADVVVLDATMPGKNPIVAMRELAAELPHVKTIVYSGHDEQDFIAGVMNAGAKGFVSKIAEPESLLLAIREVAARLS